MAAVLIDKKSSLSIHKPINRKPVNVDSIEGMTRDKDNKVVGQFVNIECPGQPAKISCRLYKGMEYFNELMKDGETYTIPLSVARFINEMIKSSTHVHLLDEKGEQVKGTKSISRYKFIIEKHL